MKKRRPVHTIKPPSPEGMPKGALAANPARINFGGSWNAPPLWYEDKKFSCRGCGKEEVWTAGQQRWWYEVMGAAMYKGAVRCRVCRKAKREAEAEQRAVSAPRLAEARKIRAQKKAAALAESLAAEGPGGFDILDQPVTYLGLDKRTGKILAEQGLHTVGDLVAHESACGIAGLYPDEMRHIRKLLEKVGLSMVGTPVSHP